MSSLSNDLLQTTLDAIQSSFVIKNVNWVVIFLDQALQDLYKLKGASILASTSYDFLSCKEADLQTQTDIALMASNSKYSEYRIIRGV